MLLQMVEATIKTIPGGHLSYWRAILWVFVASLNGVALIVFCNTMPNQNPHWFFLICSLMSCWVVAFLAPSPSMQRRFYLLEGAIWAGLLGMIALLALWKTSGPVKYVDPANLENLSNFLHFFVVIPIAYAFGAAASDLPEKSAAKSDGRPSTIDTSMDVDRSPASIEPNRASQYGIRKATDFGTDLKKFCESWAGAITAAVALIVLIANLLGWRSP